MLVLVGRLRDLLPLLLAAMALQRRLLALLLLLPLALLPSGLLLQPAVQTPLVVVPLVLLGALLAALLQRGLLLLGHQRHRKLRLPRPADCCWCPAPLHAAALP